MCQSWTHPPRARLAVFFAGALLVIAAAPGCQNHAHALDERIVGAVVSLWCYDGDGNGRRIGSGVALRHEGQEYLITAWHAIVACGVSGLRIGRQDEGAQEWRIVGADPATDIAALFADDLEITPDHPPYADRQPHYGTLGYALGFPAADDLRFPINPTTGNEMPVAVPVVTHVSGNAGVHYAGGTPSHGFSGGAIVAPKGYGRWQVTGVITHKLQLRTPYDYRDPQTGKIWSVPHREHAGLVRFTEIRKAFEIVERAQE